jgi:protein gp37
MTPVDLELSEIVRDMDIQPRERMDQARITQYAEDMLAGIGFPPVVVYFDGTTYWLSEGYHRCAAASAANIISVPAEIRQGNRTEARLNAAGSNKEWDAVTTGMRRSNRDKRRAVEMVLDVHPEWSTRQIADHVGVSQMLVVKINKERKDEERINDDRENSFHSKLLSVASRLSSVAPPAPTDTAEPPDSLFVLESEPVQREARSSSVFNETNEMVDWARWTWNPVTGCEHTCFYCYARDIANRFYAEKFTPTFRPERLDAPRNTRLPSMDGTTNPIHRTAWQNVFVCSMADLFGRWVPDEWIDRVFKACNNSPQWNYLFLTKFPQRYGGLAFPSTSWVGTTVDEQKRVLNAERAFRKIDVPVKWLSVEPMLEPITFSDLKMFDWVVIGGCSRSSGGPESYPEPEWVLRLTDQAKAAGCSVYWKENISPTKGLFKEYPSAFTAVRNRNNGLMTAIF